MAAHPSVMAGLVPATPLRSVVLLSRHVRTCPGHPRLPPCNAQKAWMPGTRPGMTVERTTPAMPAAPSLLWELQSHGAVAFRIVAPALPHFHEQEQVHLGFDNVGNLHARRLADRLDGLAALSEHDLALAFALDVDRLLDPNVARAQFLPDFGFHRRVIRQ